MAIKSEKIQGKLIINEIDSSNLKKTIYDTSKEKLVVTFKNGMEYEYEKVHTLRTLNLEWLNHKGGSLIKR